MTAPTTQQERRFECWALGPDSPLRRYSAFTARCSSGTLATGPRPRSALQRDARHTLDRATIRGDPSARGGTVALRQQTLAVAGSRGAIKSADVRGPSSGTGNGIRAGAKTAS